MSGQFEESGWVETSAAPQASAETADLARSRRALPQNIDAEQSVLAACMLNTEAMEEVATLLVPQNFHRPAHGIIFEAMMDLYKRNIPVDPISLAENLRGKGSLMQLAGAPIWLSFLTIRFRLPIGAAMLQWLSAPRFCAI